MLNNTIIQEKDGKRLVFDAPSLPKTQQKINVDRVSSTFPVQSMQKLTSMIEDSTRDIEFVTFARSLISFLVSPQQDASLNSLAEWSAVNTFYIFTKNFIRYTNDPQRTELIYSPLRTLKIIKENGAFAEDCDTIAGFFTALCLAIGIPSRLALVSFSETIEGKEPQYSHVYSEVFLSEYGLRSVDATVDEETAYKVLRKVKAIRYFTPFQVMEMR